MTEVESTWPSLNYIKAMLLANINVEASTMWFPHVGQESEVRVYVVVI